MPSSMTAKTEPSACPDVYKRQDFRQERSTVGGGSICIQVAGFTGAFHYAGDGVDDFHVYVSICVCVVLLLPGEFADT